jgi:phenolic acid decarboxylase
MNKSESMHLLDGKILLYTYEGGWSFRVRFYDGLAAYEFLGDSGKKGSNSKADIPYQSRLVREDLYHVVWHETDIGDLVSLVIDITNKRIYSAALLGYRSQKFFLHFQGGTITSFESSTDTT